MDHPPYQCIHYLRCGSTLSAKATERSTESATTMLRSCLHKSRDILKYARDAVLSCPARVEAHLLAPAKPTTPTPTSTDSTMGDEVSTLSPCSLLGAAPQGVQKWNRTGPLHAHEPVDLRGGSVIVIYMTSQSRDRVKEASRGPILPLEAHGDGDEGDFL